MKYLVIVEKGPENYSVYVPDLPGCTSAGNTLDEALEGIREAVEGHLELMRESGEPIPDPSSEAAFVEVPMAV
jgi:predicted RNase H-like HicB family nuclease